jgi:hypothetical protein
MKRGEFLPTTKRIREQLGRRQLLGGAGAALLMAAIDGCS